jgi:hypothetical protein
VEAPGDHQMDDQKELVLEFEDDALADSPQAQNPAALDSANRRLEGTQYKRTANTDLLNGFLENALLERFYIDRNVGQLGHLSQYGADAAFKSFKTLVVRVSAGHRIV